MTDQPSTATTTAAATARMQDDSASAKKQLRSDIGNKWDKFSPEELTGLKDNADLVAHLVVKYGIKEDAASADAATVVNGRTF